VNGYFVFYHKRILIQCLQQSKQSQGHEGFQGQLGQGEFLEKENRKSAEEFPKSKREQSKGHEGLQG
jgi:hypothetical protein